MSVTIKDVGEVFCWYSAADLLELGTDTKNQVESTGVALAEAIAEQFGLTPNDNLPPPGRILDQKAEAAFRAYKALLIEHDFPAAFALSQVM